MGHGLDVYSVLPCGIPAYKPVEQLRVCPNCGLCRCKAVIHGGDHNPDSIPELSTTGTDNLGVTI